MKTAAALFSLALLQALPAQLAQTSLPAYVREGNRVEQQFHGYRDQLTRFFENLRRAIQRDVSPEQAAILLRQLEKAPPAVGVFGYGMLPRIMEIPQPPTPIRSFSYSWPVTESYVRGEEAKLDKAESDLVRLAAVSREGKPARLSEIVNQYRELIRNQGTVDQYIEYNRFWQRSISEDRKHYDRMTQVYWALKSGNPDTAATIRDVLGKPKAPRFVRVRRVGSNRVVLQVRLYTDIDDDAYLAQVRTVIEETWRTEEAGIQYSVELDLRKLPAMELYRGRTAPLNGEHIDIEKHVSRFPSDGGVLTTGAEFTHGSVGRYVALGPGDLAPKTLAHEFGHILGFNDGYVRGYNDLGERGFEILELTAFFDDIMSAPREGHVQSTHFKLLMEALN
jgi:hypothetical protein